MSAGALDLPHCMAPALAGGRPMHWPTSGVGFYLAGALIRRSAAARQSARSWRLQTSWSRASLFAVQEAAGGGAGRGGGVAAPPAMPGSGTWPRMHHLGRRAPSPQGVRAQRHCAPLSRPLPKALLRAPPVQVGDLFALARLSIYYFSRLAICLGGGVPPLHSHALLDDGVVFLKA